jgi:hypothetical protein
MVQGFLATLMLTLSSVAMADAPATSVSPDPYGVYVKDVTAGGSGCSASSLSTQFAPDLSALDVQVVQGFAAQIGPGVPVYERRKNCVLTFKVHVPSGYSFAITDAEYEGYAQLDPGVTGAQSATYWFANEPNQQTGATNLSGPYDGVYERHDTVADLVWSPCGADRLANIDMQVWTNNSKNRAGNGYVSLDFSDVHVQGSHLRWHLLWQKC